jgi:hypothetical protein
MAANELPAAYRLHAAHCLEIAVQSADSENKVSLLNMAHAWLLLAEQAEKNGTQALNRDPQSTLHLNSFFRP